MKSKIFDKDLEQLEFEKTHYEKVLKEKARVKAKPTLISHLRKLNKHIKQFYLQKRRV